MIKGKNFMGLDIADIPEDLEYRGCNFARSSCVDSGGKKIGHRLFPGDDTPRLFVGCNMVNCDPPPGSTVVNCNGSIIDYDIVLSSDSIVIDGETIIVESKGWRKYGVREDDGSYTYLPTPQDHEEEL